MWSEHMSFLVQMSPAGSQGGLANGTEQLADNDKVRVFLDHFSGPRICNAFVSRL